MTLLDLIALTLCFIGAVFEIGELFEKRGLALYIFCGVAALVEIVNHCNTQSGSNTTVVQIGNNSMVLSNPSVMGRVETHELVRPALDPSFTTTASSN